MTARRYSGSEPLMWFQERNREKGTPLLIGCTACNWWTHPVKPVTMKTSGGWRYYESLFIQHRFHAHGIGENTFPADDPRHGTRAGHRAHCVRGQVPCTPCREAAVEYNRQHRSTVKNHRPFPDDDPRHGTPAGAAAHKVRGTELCQPCREAKRANDRAWKNGKKDAA